MAETVKIIELVGTSEESWEEAAQHALDDATETLEHISGVEVESQTAEVEYGEISKYKTTLSVAFGLADR